MLCQELSKEGFGTSSSLAPDSTLSLSGIPMAHAKAAAEKQQSMTLVNQSFDERKIVVLRSDAADKTAKQSESDDHFRLDYLGGRV
jgi:hypothetical protein